MKIVVVINSSAGSLIRLDPHATAGMVAERMEGAGHTVRTAVVDGGKPLVDAVTSAVREQADVVVIGGGDGTIRTAAHQLSGSDTALGVLPLGTMNLLARDLGIPLDLAKAAAALAEGTLAAIDVAEVNGEIFLCQSTLGIVPELAIARERYRGKHWLVRMPGMVLSFIRILIRTGRLMVALDRGFGPERIRVVSFAVSNNSLEEGFACLPKRNALDQGNLEVTLIKSRSGWGYLWTSILALLGRSRQHRQVESYPLPELTVISHHRKLMVANDGEVQRLKTPLRYQIRSRALKVLVPQPQP